MKAPKNYYNVVDQKKLGLDQIDKNAAAIAELQDLPVLPDVTDSDNSKILQVVSGDYSLTVALQPRNILVTGANGIISSTAYLGIRLTENENGSIAAGMFNSTVTFSQLQVVATIPGILVAFTKKTGEIYHGVSSGSTATTLCANVFDDDGVLYKLVATASSYTLTPIGSSVIIDVTISGSDVTLPTGYDYASIKALVDAGVDVKLTDGSDIFTLQHDHPTAGMSFASIYYGSSSITVYQIEITSTSNTFSYGTIS